MQLRRKLTSSVKGQPSHVVTESVEFILLPGITRALIEEEGFQHHRVGNIECLGKIHGVDSAACLAHLDVVIGINEDVQGNGEFYGFYTFNTPKDEDLFGIGESTTDPETGEVTKLPQAVFCADTHADGTAFKGHALVDETDFSYKAEEPTRAESGRGADGTLPFNSGRLSLIRATGKSEESGQNAESR